jgi:arylformamidase
MTRPDPAWLTQQYNNRARVPEYAQIFERWAEASKRSRDGLSRRLDVAYGPGPNETLDVFPSPKARAPVLVFIHGGWWRSLDKSDHSFVAPTFVHAGAMVVVPNYALCPGTPKQPVTIESIALQLVRALAWTYRNAALYGGDPRRIVVVGHSAGAHLAAMMLSCQWQQVAPDLPAQLVQSALAISGLYDLAPIVDVPFLKDDLKLTAASARKLSPVLFPKPKGKLLALVGANESEEFLRQTAAIEQAWGPKAVPVCEGIAGTNHYDVLHDLADPAGRSQRLTRELLGLA